MDKKHKDLLTKPEMVKRIKQRLKNDYSIEASKNLISKILEVFDDEIYMVIAEERCYKFLWGYIGGKSKPPTKVSGLFAEIKSIKDNYGYSNWKKGYPWVDWANVTKIYDIYPPQDYFELPEIRYTTAARTFRKDAGLPEIPEYADLEESKILEYCKKADKINLDKLTSKQRKNKQRDDKFNKLKTLAMQDYWKKTNYTPMGATDKNWDGDNIDSVDRYLINNLPKAKNLTEKLETVLIAQEIGEWKNEIKDHPELEEIISRIKEELKEAGIEPLPYVKKEFKKHIFDLKYNGQDDPWGLKNVSVSAELHRKRVEKEERELLEALNNEKNKDNS